MERHTGDQQCGASDSGTDLVPSSPLADDIAIGAGNNV